MRALMWLAVPFLFLIALSCGLCSGIQKIQDVATTQIPSILTAVPTTQGMIETAVAVPTSDCGTPAAGGLGIGLDRARSVLQATGQFTFTESTSADGQPVSTASLSGSAASSYPSIANEFSAQFIGDPCNLSRILITAPYTDQQSTVNEGLAAATVLFSAIMPLDIQIPLVTWLAQNYTQVPVSGEKQTTIKNMTFTLRRSASQMTLDIVPSGQ
jgi:hypothetical protein